jgi:hypothetical protein
MNVKAVFSRGQTLERGQEFNVSFGFFHDHVPDRSADPIGADAMDGDVERLGDGGEREGEQDPKGRAHGVILWA